MTHEWGFARVAELVRQGELLPPPERVYYSREEERPLPRYLADLSTDGTVYIVAYQDDKPVIFLPQILGFLDGAVGYVYSTANSTATLNSTFSPTLLTLATTVSHSATAGGM